MNAERFASFRRLTEHCEYHDDGNDVVACTCAEPLDARPLITELIGYVDELTCQRDDARRMCVDSGYFTNLVGVEYVGRHKPDHTQYPGEVRPVRVGDLPGNATCSCSWCRAMPSA